MFYYFILKRFSDYNTLNAKTN